MAIMINCNLGIALSIKTMQILSKNLHLQTL